MAGQQADQNRGGLFKRISLNYDRWSSFAMVAGYDDRDQIAAFQ